MRSIIRIILNSILSVMTTFLLMAAPVAAIVYASEAPDKNSTYITRGLSLEQENGLVTRLDWVEDRVDDWKPDLLEESIASLIQHKKTKREVVKQPVSGGGISDEIYSQ